MTRPDAPRVSVVMAVYDGEPFLRAALDSVLAQTFRDFELIVVDDGSTDGSAAIVRAIADPRVRLLSNERNLGLAPSLNRGVNDARGEFVARLDADDVAMPDRLARQVAFLDANPDVGMTGSWYVELADDGSETPRELPVDHWDLRWHLCLYSPFVHSAVTWRRALVRDRIGAYDERLAYSMDYDLWRRMASVFRVANVPAHLVRVRTHAGSMTSALGSRSSEGLAMRAAHAAKLLGWPEGSQADREERLDRLYRLAVSTPRAPLGRQWLRDARELLRFHDAFVAAEQVPPEIARAQRRTIVAGLARRLWRASLGARARGRKPR